SAFIPVDGVTSEELADAAQLASLADETPEGRSIVVLAKEQFNLRGRSINQMHMELILSSAKTSVSGVNYLVNDMS
ncbi:potassium-transporting ATPase subunit B, partial [Blautia wexlerae]|nr:potassium-transporting ATPase subunit B [Blautia wexlerae]